MVVATMSLIGYGRAPSAGVDSSSGNTSIRRNSIGAPFDWIDM
jgi:hypothetical protein